MTYGELRAHAQELAWAIECHDDESVSACLVAISQSSLVPDVAGQRRARRLRLLCEAIAAHERGRNAPHEASRSTGLPGSTVHYVRGRPVFS